MARAQKSPAKNRKSDNERIDAVEKALKNFGKDFAECSSTMDKRVGRAELRTKNAGTSARAALWLAILAGFLALATAVEACVR